MTGIKKVLIDFELVFKVWEGSWELDAEKSFECRKGLKIVTNYILYLYSCWANFIEFY